MNRSFHSHSQVLLFFLGWTYLIFGGGCASKALAPRTSPAAPENSGIAPLESTLQKDPWRLDIRFQLAQLYQDQDDFELQYDLWARTLQMRDKNADDFLWENDGPPPESPSRSIPSRLQGSIDHYLDLKTEEATARALRLSKLGATYFPGRRSFERSRALCYSRRGDPEASVRCLLRLLQKDPQDVTTLRMMADVLEKAGKRKGARIYRRKAEKLSEPAREGEEKNGVILTY